METVTSRGLPPSNVEPSQKPQPQGASVQQSMQEASGYLGLGMQIALSMAFFVGVGYLLDFWLETTPWFLVAGSVLGMGAIFIQIFRVVGEMNKKSQTARKQASSKGNPALGDDGEE